MQPTLKLSLFTLLFAAACAGDVTTPPDEVTPRRDAGNRATRDAGFDRDAAPTSTRQIPGSEDDDDDGNALGTGPDARRIQTDAGPAVAASGCSVDREQSLALGLRMREIALYQSVKVGLFKDGVWTQPSSKVPVIAERRSLVRVLADTLPGYVAHPVRAVLTLKTGDQVTTLKDERTLSTSSTEAQLESGFSFDVPGANVLAGTELSVSLEELTCSKDTGDSAMARFPVSGTQPLDLLPVGKLRVVILPIAISGRLPVTNEAELTKLKAALYAYYPVPDVEITVHAPVSWTGRVSGTDDTAWVDLLDQIMALRRSDKAESDTYYFGLMQPAATFRAYCDSGCILGLAPQTFQVTPSQQVGLGASFADAQTYETVVHELGHAHGRGHSPCVKRGASIDGVDKNYPDRAGSTVSWGWDNRKNLLMPPTTHEIMGYCDAPNWISEYNYTGIAARSSKVNQKALALVYGASTMRWAHVLLYKDGVARWGSSTDTERPGGTVEIASVLDAEGNEIDHVEVVRASLSHSDSQFVYFPEPAADWSALQLHDRVLMLSDFLPAH